MYVVSNYNTIDDGQRPYSHRSQQLRGLFVVGRELEDAESDAAFVPVIGCDAILSGVDAVDVGIDVELPLVHLSVIDDDGKDDDR